jgi:hypothetical protein
MSACFLFFRSLTPVLDFLTAPTCFSCNISSERRCCSHINIRKDVGMCMYDRLLKSVGLGFRTVRKPD